MLKSDFIRWHNENYESFLCYKARYILAKNGKSFSEVTELVAQTIEVLLNKLDKIDEKSINSYAFIILQNLFFNNFYNNSYSKKVCCVGDISRSDFGTNEDYYLDQNKLVDIIEEKQEVQHKAKQLELINNYTKLLPHEQKIIDCYTELRSVPKVARMLNIESSKVTWLIKKVRTGAFKQKGFQNLNKNCYICGGKHFSKGLCSLHYQQKRRNG